MKKLILNIPNAEILIHSMRSIGYDFETAVSDLIDNSITAKAKNIDLYYQTSSRESLYLTIIDDGTGMTREELIEAMRFGTDKHERTKDDLGRFGLGLKTASISPRSAFPTVIFSASLRSEKVIIPTLQLPSSIFFRLRTPGKHPLVSGGVNH